MILKIMWCLREFYEENIFEIYDKFIQEEGENILNKVLDKYVKELHNCANKMANNEINNIIEKKMNKYF